MPDPEKLHTAFFLFWSGNICHRLKNTRLAVENPTGTFLPMIHCILKVVFSLSECFRLLEQSTRYLWDQTWVWAAEWFCDTTVRLSRVFCVLVRGWYSAFEFLWYNFITIQRCNQALQLSYGNWLCKAKFAVNFTMRVLNYILSCS